MLRGVLSSLQLSPPPPHRGGSWGHSQAPLSGEQALRASLQARLGDTRPQAHSKPLVVPPLSSPRPHALTQFLLRAPPLAAATRWRIHGGK